MLVVPHHVALSDVREARDRLGFVKALLGYVYVRPLGLAARRKVGTRREGG